MEKRWVGPAITSILGVALQALLWGLPVAGITVPPTIGVIVVVISAVLILAALIMAFWWYVLPLLIKRGKRTKMIVAIGLILIIVGIVMVITQLNFSSKTIPATYPNFNSTNSQKIIISDLFSGIDTIAGKTFEGYDIYGPADIQFIGPLHMEYCRIIGDENDVIQEVSQTGNIEGVVTFADCIFSHCNFIDVKILLNTKADPARTKFFRDFWQYPSLPTSHK